LTIERRAALGENILLKNKSHQMMRAVAIDEWSLAAKINCVAAEARTLIATLSVASRWI